MTVATIAKKNDEAGGNVASDERRRYAAPKPTMNDRDPATSKTTALDAVITNPPFTRYAGGKNGMGVFQRLISLMPPHDVYIEPFLGSGVMMRRKKPAKQNIGIDISPRAIDPLNRSRRDGFQFICGDSFAWLERTFVRNRFPGERVMIYADPPYQGSARARNDRDCYIHELKSDEGHFRLLRILTTLPAMVMLSGYRSALYDSMLKTWTRVDYLAQTRGGLKPESVWMNYPQPTHLHDYRYLGVDYHDRCRIGRKIKRMTAKLAALPVLERNAIIDALNGAAGGSR